MKSLFFSFALLLCGTSVFAANESLTPVTDCEPIASAIEVSVLDDEICYSANVNVNVGANGLSVGATIQVSGCGETAAEAWNNFMEAMGFANEQ